MWSVGKYRLVGNEIPNPCRNIITILITERENTMKNKKYIRNLSMIAASLCIALTACGTENSGILTATVEQAVEASAESTAAAGQTAETDSEAEGPLAQRDALEWEQRLDYTTERQAQLAEITVELAQDTEDVQSKAQPVLDAMADGNADAAVDSILAEDWYTVMLSDLLIGQRNYTGTTDNGDWKMLILSDELGQRCTAIEYPLADGREFYVQVSDNEIRYYVCAENETGAFTSGILNLSDGTYTGYEGTLSAANLPEGKLTVHMGTTDPEAGATEAFRNRSAQAVTYEGEFTAEGKPATETPAKQLKEGNVAYAVRQEGNNTYYLTIAAEEIQNAFTPEQLGIVTIWD